MLGQDIKVLRPLDLYNLGTVLPNQHKCKMALIRNILIRREIRVHSDGQRIFGRQSILVGLKQANRLSIKGR